MNPATASLAALALVIAVSCFLRLNPGVLAVFAAWVVGAGLAGMNLKEIAGGFPAELFLTLAGVTLLFSQAQNNGTLERAARWAVTACRGRAGLVPVMFFFLAAAMASLGPGNIAASALLAPLAMTAAGERRIPPFLMAIMLGNGANAGALSPLAPTGIIVNNLMARIQLPGLELWTWWYCLLAHALVGFAGYLLFGGWRLLSAAPQPEPPSPAAPLERAHYVTLGVLAALVMTVAVFGAPVGMAAFGCAAALSLARVADDGAAIRAMPWNVILMVCGVTVLISILERTAGISLLAAWMARISTPESVTAVSAFVTGLISAYSSTSGVVLPAFLPVAPELAAQLGPGASAFATAMSINIGSNLVDVSPLSTIGALCIAAAPAGTDTRKLFHQLLAWGLSMTVAGAALSWLLFRA